MKHQNISPLTSDSKQRIVPPTHHDQKANDMRSYNEINTSESDLSNRLFLSSLDHAVGKMIRVI